MNGFNMSTYILQLVIHHNDDEKVFDLIPSEFRSLEYLHGFIDAMGFGRLRLTSIDDFVDAVNKRSTTIDKSKFKVVSVIHGEIKEYSVSTEDNDFLNSYR